MQDTISRYLEGVANVGDRRFIQQIVNPIGDRLSSQPLASAGLVIFGAGSPLAKTGAAVFYALAKGALVKIAAATSMPALVGTVANATFNVFYFFVDANSVVTSQMGGAGTTLATVVHPQTPVGQSVVGFIIVNPTGTGAFVGGTTNLDDVTVVPNAAFISPLGAFDATVLI